MPLYKIDPKSGLFVYKRKAERSNDLDAGNTQPSLDNFRLAPHIPYQSEATSTKHTISSFETVLKDAEQLYAVGERRIQSTFRKQDNIVLDNFTEALPEDLVSPDDIWWLTSQDIFDHFKIVDDRKQISG